MSKEFLYDVEGMKEVRNRLLNITENMHDMKSNIQSAKSSIGNMESLGFLDTKNKRVEQIESNIVECILVGLEDYQKMINQNASDVAGTDHKLASQIEGAGKWV